MFDRMKIAKKIREARIAKNLTQMNLEAEIDSQNSKRVLYWRYKQTAAAQKGCAIMFDTMKIAKKIREARIAKNLTQMNLADAMGVSYQAVSNWERGNSMPDISKLGDLCQVLDIRVQELLGIENRETAAVSKILEDADVSLTMEELTEIAPMLPPEQVKEQAEKTSGEKKKLNVSALAGIVPFLDDDFLEEIIEEAEVESLRELECLAPFLSEEALDKLVEKAPAVDFGGIAALAPFLSEETLDAVVRRCGRKPEDAAFLETLAPFLTQETLNFLVRQEGAGVDVEMLEALASFLEEDTIDALAEEQIAQGNVDCLSGLYPFMGNETMRKVVRALMAEGDIEGLRAAAGYL